MSVRYRVRHETRYAYDGEVAVAYNRATLTPRALSHQRVLSSTLTTWPDTIDRDEHIDAFGNNVTSFSIEQPHRALSILCVSEVELFPRDGQLSIGGVGPWEDAVAATARAAGREQLFCYDSPFVHTDGDVAAYAAPSFPAGRPLADAVGDLTRRINRDFTYQPGVTMIGTPVRDVLQRRAGVCQDFAHLQLACLRAMGLAARYVSGYLETLPPPGHARLVGADASHAWCAVRQADGSWLDLDPTNDLVAPSAHITLAWGRDYGDVAPLTGVIVAGPVSSTLSVAVDVVRLDPPG